MMMITFWSHWAALPADCWNADRNFFKHLSNICPCRLRRRRLLFSSSLLFRGIPREMIAILVLVVFQSSDIIFGPEFQEIGGTCSRRVQSFGPWRQRSIPAQSVERLGSVYHRSSIGRNDRLLNFRSTKVPTRPTCDMLGFDDACLCATPLKIIWGTRILSVLRCRRNTERSAGWDDR